MRSPLIALAALPLLATPLVATGPAAAATCTSPQLVNASVSPGTVVLGTGAPKGVEITVNVRKRSCGVSRVATDLFTDQEYVDTLELEEGATKNGITTYTTGARITPGGFPNSDAGRFSTRVYVTWGNRNLNEDGPGFRLLRAARLTANATPEPVTRGRTITVRGNLTRANWDTLAYGGYSKRAVTLQFRPNGGRWATLKNVTSGAGGALRTTVRAGRDGCFRFAFAGNSTTAKVTSAGDCVDVR